MTTPSRPSGAPSGTVLAVVVGVVFCFTVAAVVGLVVAAPEGSAVETTITILLGSLASTVAALVALLKVDNVHDTVGKVAADTESLTNGLMDSKIRAAVAEVLAPGMVDPAARELLDADVERRDNHTRGR